jgi:hypothetical protein
MLFNHGIQLRIPDNLGSPANHLSPVEYQSHFKELNKYNLTTLADIFDPATKRTINYNKFFSEDKTRWPLLSIPGPPPKWFTVLIRSIVKRRVTVSYSV